MGGEWQTLSLGEIYQFSSGLSKPRSSFGSGHPFLSFKDVLYSSVVPNQLSELVQSTEQERERCSVTRGDVFLTRTSETMDELGMSCVALTDIPNATFNGFTKRLRPRGEQIAPEFARYYFRSSKFRASVNSMSTMSTRASLNNEMLERLTITFPEYAEQEAIGHILGTLDDKIELNRRRNQTLEAMARALFQDWFVDFGPVRAKMEGREPYLPAELWRLFPERLDEAGKPAGWEEVAAEIVADVGIGKTPPRKESQWFSTADTDVPWVSIRDMGNSGVFLQETSEFLTAEAVEKFNVRVVPDNTVILSFKLTVGRVAITDGEMVTNEAIAHLKVRDENTYSSEYLYCYLREFDFGRLGNTSSIATAVNSKSIKALPILVPTNDLVRCFSDRVSPIFTCIKQLQSEAGVLAQLRDTLLPKLISGELRVADAEKFVEHVGP